MKFYRLCPVCSRRVKAATILTLGDELAKHVANCVARAREREKQREIDRRQMRMFDNTNNGRLP